MKKTTIIEAIGVCLMSLGVWAFFVDGLGCSLPSLITGLCFSGGRFDVGASVFIVGILLIAIGLVLFFAVYEYDYSQKWTWWRQE